MGRKPQEQPLPQPTSGTRNRAAVPAVCGVLLLAVFIVFGQTARFEFVNYDDPEYVSENAHVTKGLTIGEIAWALTGSHAANWHPLTSLSHLLDYEIYGPYAGGHHATNVLLHAAAAILLFLALRRMTDDLWPAALVAALFAIHPLRAESVAWVAERKDVLSGLFFMLTLAAYLAYVRHPFSVARYLLLLVTFALGLMSKPMLVTLPFVLLLLDYWPLGRIKPRPVVAPADMRPLVAPTGMRPVVAPTGMRQVVAHGATRPEGGPPIATTGRGFMLLIIEKIPLFALAAASCVITTLAQGQAVVAVDAMPLYARALNAPVACVAYLGQFFCPTGLSPFYPHLGPDLPLWQPIIATLVLAGVTAVVWAWRRRAPYLAVGWFWYLGMLVPVIGLVQVGAQARADRYTYLPQIGLCIALAWGTSQLVAARPACRWACGFGWALALMILAACAWRQTTFWRSSESLWRHALQCDDRNALAQERLGATLMGLEEADQEGDHRIDEAIDHYQKAIGIHPSFAEAHYNLGVALARRGQPDAAITEYREALKFKPEVTNALFRLGSALADRGQPAKAIAQFRTLLARKPDDANAHYVLGAILKQQGQTADALVEWREAIRLQPSNIGIADQLAWTLATSPDASVRNGPEAVALAQRAVQLSGGREPTAFGTLAAAYAEAGQFSEAVQAAERAIALASARGDAAAAATVRGRLNLYRAGSPYRDTPPPHK
jgi:protein O-mannosyl-transferase